MAAGIHAQSEGALRVVSCDGKTSTITAPPGYEYLWFKSTPDVLHEPNHWNTLPADITFRKNGSLKGKFSISATEKVYFSPGNLEYRAYDHRFRFAREQWYTSYMPYGYKGQRDDNGWTPYLPQDSATAWSGAIDIENSIYGHEWFAMTQEQWTYLLSQRPNAAKRWGYGVINDLQCLVLLPDSWSNPAGLTFAAQDTNRYTFAEWREMEKKGAVALPYGGYSAQGAIREYGQQACYWPDSPANGACMVRMVRWTEETQQASTPEDPEPTMIDTCITIDWNQMVQKISYGTTVLTPCDTITTERRYIANKTTRVSSNVLHTDGLSARKGHKVLIHIRFKSNFTNRISFYYNNGVNHTVYPEHFVPDEWCDIATIIDGFQHVAAHWSGALLAMLKEGEYISLPNDGGMVYFDLTQMFGAGNEPTKEQFLERFPDINYPFTAGEFRQICDFPVRDTLQICPHQSEPLAGALNGLFSVAPDKQVQFSQGNLQYQPSSKTWRFASEQWEVLGTDNNKPTTTMTRWMDLFAWGCSGYSKGIKWYNPIRRGLFPRDTANFWINNDPNQDMTGEFADADWAVYNAISNGGNEKGLWRTMTKDEWQYLLFDRPNAPQRRAYVDIDGHRGLVFLSDEWQTPDGITILTDINHYTIDEWRRLEQAGAVFLPAAGICNTSSQYEANIGWYWSATAEDKEMSSCVHFDLKTEQHSACLGGCYRGRGIAVRPVIDKHKMDSLQLADNRLLRKYASVEWNQLLKGLNYDRHRVRLDTTLPDENRYEILQTELSPTPAIYTSGTDASYGRKVVVHVRFKSNCEKAPYLRWYDGVNYTELYPEYYIPNEWCTIRGLVEGFKPGPNTGFMPDSAGYQAGEYISLPKDGGFMLFDLTRMFGSGYEASMDEFLRLFPQDNFPYEKGRAMDLCEVAEDSKADMSALDHSDQYANKNGQLNGYFSVAANKQIRFSSGNLQYQPSTNTWRFAEHQYDISGAANNNPSATTSNWLDLFAWGTSGWSSGAPSHQPWSTEQNDTCYWLGGQMPNSLTGTYKNADWGVYNAISNGGNKAGLWHTMTRQEMQYLINGRTNARQLRALAVVEGQRGMLLLPDDWTCPAGLTVVQGNDGTDVLFQDNVYTAAQWQKMEEAGAVFLPLAGAREGMNSAQQNSSGVYWASDYSSDNSATCLYVRNSINDYTIGCGSAGRHGGHSVRLVIDKEQAEQAQNDYLHYDSGLLDNVACPLEASVGRCKPIVETGSNGVYTLTLDFTVGYPDADQKGSFRMNFPLYILEGHETDQFYVSFKYKRLAGKGDFTKFDWCDRRPVEIVKEIKTENYTYVLLKMPILAHKPPYIQYSQSFRYLDVESVFAGDVYRIWDIKLGANPWVDPIDEAEVKNFAPFATTGVFTVGEGKQILFSRGNLQYQASSNTWRFAEQQYDAIGVRNQFIAPDYTGWIDLFGWGTSGYDVTPQSLWLRNCYPWSVDTLERDVDYATEPLYDWGVYNRIANGGNVRGLWRTPRFEELMYVLNKRPNAAQRKAFAIICGSKGVILLPDNCTLPNDFPWIPASSSNQYDANRYDHVQWQVLERLGALFIPCTGMRIGTQVQGPEQPNVGYYWTVGQDPDAEPGTEPDSPDEGQAVRLVTDVLSTDSQIVVKADSSIWCCRLTSPDTTFVLSARAIGRLNYYEFVKFDTICAGDTVFWREDTLTQSGYYADSMLTIYGCDSIYAMHLTVLQHSDSVEIASIYEGETYTWHGHKYTTTIYVADTLVNAVGCDSICTLHLTVLQHSDSVEYATICEGDYLWHGRIYTHSIDTTETLINAVGCDSICTLHLTVLQHSDSTETVTINEGDTYTWHGRTYTQSIDTTEILTNAAGCDSICTLHLYTRSYDTVYFCAGCNTIHEQQLSPSEVRRYLPFVYESPEQWNYHEGMIVNAAPGRMCLDLQRVEQNLYAHYTGALEPVSTINWSYRAGHAPNYIPVIPSIEPFWLAAGELTLYVRFTCGHVFCDAFVIPDRTEGIDAPTAEEGEVRKIFSNGIIYILRGGKTYTLTGQEIR